MAYSGFSLGTTEQAPRCYLCGAALYDQSKCSDISDEWEAISQRGCGYCGFNCTYVWPFGTVCTPGSKAVCEKKRYSALPTTCCLGLMPDGFPKKTCDPKYTYQNPECWPIIRNYCSEGNRLFDDPLCNSWKAADREQAYTAAESMCKNVDKLRNNYWCRGWAINDAMGKIDDIMQTFCATYPEDNLCDCILSDIPCPNKFDARCTQNQGYQTKSMLETKCPDVMNCSQFLGISEGSRNFAVHVDQNCAPEPKAPESQKTLTASQWWIFILIVAAVFVSLIFLADEDEIPSEIPETKK